ncbi:hypothetical protein KKF34_09680 [Myxococcota bacterium]|nr:hypothetical protein [Myxococcota bacterium]MBU1380549.1 hypothetical protein [Myxococcota bacterium]MBU1497134.1 hypothetical protein [Myxococcota bacterium]
MKQLLESLNNKLENSFLRIPVKIFILLFITFSTFFAVGLAPFAVMDHLRIYRLDWGNFPFIFIMISILTIVVFITVLVRLYRQRPIEWFSATLFAGIFFYDLIFFLTANFYWMFVDR